LFAFLPSIKRNFKKKKKRISALIMNPHQPQLTDQGSSSQAATSSQAVTSPPTPKRQKKESAVWSHFREEDGFNFCIHCRAKYALSSGCSTLMHHLETRHKENCQTIQTSIVNAIKFPLPHEEQQKVQTALISFIVQDEQAFSVAESPSFKALVAVLNPRASLPSKKTLIKEVEEQAKIARDKIKAELNGNQSNMCLTTDGWTSIALDSYQAITAHWISDDWRLRHLLLGFPLLTESHTGEHLTAVLVEVIQGFGIQL